MQFQNNPYLAWQLFTTLIMLGIIIYIQTRPVRKRESSVFALMMFGGIIWSIANAAQWISPNISWQLRWNSLLYIGVLLIPTALFLFSVRYTRIGLFQVEKISMGLWIIPSITYVVIITNDFHNLFYTSQIIRTLDKFAILESEYGILFYAHTAYSYLLLFSSMVILLYSLINNFKNFGIHAYGLVLGILAPLVGNIYYLFGPIPEGFPDPTPFLFTITGLSFSWAIFGSHILEAVEIAHGSIVQNLSNGIVVLDMENQILDINPMALKILELPNELLYGLPFNNFIKSNLDFYETINSALEKIMISGPNITVQLLQGNKSFDVVISHILNNSGQKTGRLLEFWDVSEKIKVEERLETNRTAYEATMDSLNDSYFEADSKGVITFANKAFIESTGYLSKKDIIGKRFWHFTDRTEVRGIFKKFIRLYETKKPLEPFDYKYKKRDGSINVGEIVVSPIFKHGEVKSTRGIIRDISVRVKAEEVLREAKESAEFRARELAAINLVAEKAGQSLDLQEILQAVCQEMTAIFKVKNVSISLINSEEDGFEIYAFYSIDSNEDNSIGTEFKIESSIAIKEVYKTQKTLAIQDAQFETSTKSFQEINRDQNKNAILLLPLIIRGRMIGSIGMSARDSDHQFSENEIHLAETISLQVASAIDNAQLYEQTQTALGAAQSDLEIGSQIQSGFFPSSIPNLPGWEIATYFQSARQVAGDFYDVFQLKGTKLTAFVIADVCDKGVGAALFMVLFRSLLRAFSDEETYSENINQKILKIISKTNKFVSIVHGQSNMFATIFFGILDPESGILHYINGGHEPPIILNKEGDIINHLMPNGPAVGLFPDLEFLVDEVFLDQGDILVGFTDGVTEAKNDEDQLFSEEGLIKSITAPWTSIFSMIFELEVELRNHIGGRDQYDDITLISLRRKLTEEPDYHAICRPAIFSMLSEMREFVELAGKNSGLNDEIVFNFKLSAEEILTNVIQYGYIGQSPGVIALSFVCEQEKAVLKIWDDGLHFPFDQADTPNLEAGWDERVPGGLGIFLVKEMMDTVTYSRENNQSNLLVLEKNIIINN